MSSNDVMNDAAKRVADFFRCECPYVELIELTAAAQGEILDMYTSIDPSQRETVHLDNINNFFFYIIRLLMETKALDERIQL